MSIILKPFAWLLLFLYELFSSYGLALIIFAVVVKLILFPVTLKSKKSMIQTTMLSGQMQKLKDQYGKNPERYNLEVQKLYEKEKINPMGGCLWSLIPMFVLIGLYGIIREPLFQLMNVPEDMIATMATITGVANEGAYPQIAMAKALENADIMAKAQAALAGTGAELFAMDFSFIGLDLSAIPTWKFWTNGVTLSSIGMFVLPLVSTVVSFISMKVSMSTNQINKDAPSNAQADQMNKTMMWMMPLMSLWIGFTVPAGLTVYWITQYLITMVQEYICSKMLKKDYEAARAAAEERARQEKEEEKRRKEEARLERARRIEEEKNNKGKKKKTNAPKKDIEPEQEGVNKDDSREGIRAYARGRAYIPNRFDGVTEYVDPNVRLLDEAMAKSKKKKDKTAPAQEEAKAAPAEEIVTPEETVEQPVQNENAAPAELPAEVETVEVEVEVEEIEVEVDENKEGV